MLGESHAVLSEKIVDGIKTPRDSGLELVNVRINVRKWSKGSKMAASSNAGPIYDMRPSSTR